MQSPPSKHNRRSSIDFFASDMISNSSRTLSGSKIRSNRRNKSDTNFLHLIPAVEETEMEFDLDNIENSELIRSIPNKNSKIEDSKFEGRNFGSGRLSAELLGEKTNELKRKNQELDESLPDLLDSNLNESLIETGFETETEVVRRVGELRDIEGRNPTDVGTEGRTCRESIDFKKKIESDKDRPPDLMRKSNSSFYVNKLELIQSSDRTKLKMDEETYKNLSPQDQQETPNRIRNFEKREVNNVREFEGDFLEENLLSLEKQRASQRKPKLQTNRNPTQQREIQEIKEESDYSFESNQKESGKYDDDFSQENSEGKINSLSNYGIMGGNDIHSIQETSREGELYSNSGQSRDSKRDRKLMKSQNQKLRELDQNGRGLKVEKEKTSELTVPKGLYKKGDPDRTQYYSMNEGSRFVNEEAEFSPNPFT